MSCNSAIYTNNQTATAIPAGGLIPFGTIIRRFCSRHLNAGDSAITVCGKGYYDVSVSATMVATGAGIATIALQSDGANVPGATASTTVAAGDTFNLDITALIREFDCNTSNLTLVLTGVAATVTNISTVVKKI